MNVLRIRCECNKVLRVREEKIARGGACPNCRRRFSAISPEAFANNIGRTISAEEMQSLAETAAPMPAALTPKKDTVWQVGKIVENKFEVKGFLGEGSFGAVWHVWDQEHEMDLAVKELRPDKVATPQRRTNFLREARAWILELGLHPHVVTAWWVLDIGGNPCLFLEYCPGGSLAEWIDQGKTRELATALDIGIQLCWGLAHCHAKGIVHRDFKPANVIMGAQGEAKITDFGTVKFAATENLDSGEDDGVIHDLRRTIGGQLQGTPPYMPPEQWHKGAAVDFRADFYALGVTLFEMLTGEFPIRAAGRDIPAWIAAHRASAPPAVRDTRPDAPASLDTVIQQCLAKPADARPATALDTARRLTAIYQQMTGRAYERTEPKEAELLADSVNNQGVSLLAMSDAGAARTAWENALQIDSSHPEAIYNLGMTRWHAGEIGDDVVVRSVKQVCAANGERPDAAIFLGQVHLERGDYQEAFNVLENIDLQGSGQKKREQIIRQAEAQRSESACCLRTFSGHLDRVVTCLTGDAKLALSGSYDKTLKLWDVGSGRCLRTFKGHTDKVTSVSLSGDARLALSGSSDRTLKLWEVASGRCLRTFERHSSAVTSVCLSGDAHLALSGSTDHTLKLWDLARGNCLRTFQGHSSSVGLVLSVCLSSDARLALSGSYDKTLKLWEVSTGNCLRTFEGHSGRVNSVCITSDARLALSGSDDSTLKLWDVSSGNCLRNYGGHSNVVKSVCLSGDARVALSGGEGDDTLKLWEVSSGRCLRTFKGHSSAVNSVCLSHDARLGLTGSWDGTLKLWRLSVPGEASRLFAPVIARPPSSVDLGLAARFTALLAQARKIEKHKPARAIEIVREARMLPGCARRPQALDAWRRMYSIASRTSFKGELRISTMSAKVDAVCLSNDASLALSGSNKLGLKLWDVSSGRCLRTFKDTSQVRSVCLSSDARLALSESRDNTLKLWDVSSGGSIRTFKGRHTAEVRSVCLSSDARLALSGSYDKTVKLWEVSSGNCLRTFEGDEGHTGPVNCVFLSFDTSLVLSGSDDKSLKLWELSTGRCLHTFTDTFQVESVCLSGDASLALSGGSRELKLWEVASGRCLRTFEGHSGYVRSVCLSSDGHVALSGSDDKTVKLWEVASGRCLRTIEGHAGPVTSVCLSGDDSLALSASTDGAVVWFLDWELKAMKRDPA